MPVLRATGCARRRPETTRHFLATRRYDLAATTIESVLQPLATLHDQRRRSSCVGQAHGQGIESITGSRVSCVRLWEDSKRIQGDTLDPEAGTLGEYAIEAITRSGWCDYTEGEDEREESLDTDGRIADSVGAALTAWDRRGRVVIHKTLDLWGYPLSTVRAQLVAALQQPNTYLVLEGGTKPLYFDPPADTVLGTDARGGDSGGHAERIVGYRADVDAAILQGSWGNWTFCRSPSGVVLPGCALVSMAVIQAAWAVDAITLGEP